MDDQVCLTCNECGSRVFVVYGYTIRCLSCGHKQSIKRDKRKVDEFKVRKAERLLSQLKSVRSIAKEVGVSPMTISRLKRKMYGHK